MAYSDNIKQNAISLRLKGTSIKNVAKQLNISVGTASNWLRDFLLDDDATEKIKKEATINRARGKSKYYRERRQMFQEEGKYIAKQNNPLHIMGCMLYWAEGGKKKNSCVFCNSDPYMMKVFLSFIRQFFSVNDTDIKIRVTCHEDKDIHELESFWLDLLKLPPSSVQKGTVKPTVKRFRKTLKYGVCTIQISRTEIVQHIFGAISQYGDIDFDYCLG